jgi:signal transduction histidine kinase
MNKNRLSNFIRDNMESILQEWENFARTIEPAAQSMDDEALRDHAKQMLTTIAADLDTAQSDSQRVAKSLGLGTRGRADTPAETHAETRLQCGYSVVQLVSEYRALRSSVLALWAENVSAPEATDLRDVTRFNEAVDQALAESVARYQDLVKQSQNMFLAILGHDLRNPLGTVVSGLSCIMQAETVPPRYVLMSTRMFTSAKRMSNLINDLIDFTRTHLGPGIPLRVRETDLVAVCQGVVDEMRIFHPERMVELSAPAELRAFFDDGRIAQMLSNFVGNAIQYGTAGTPVSIRLGNSAEHIELAINNKGPTIPNEKKSTIFDPMVRLAGSASTDYTERTSLGIGLFIAREIVHAHGGQVEVNSNAEDGTTFTVSLPRRHIGLRSTDSPAVPPCEAGG